MADEISTPGECPDDCDGATLETLRQVRVEMAKACRLIKAGKLDCSRGHVLLTGLGMLAKQMQDARDSKWVTRTKLLWVEREALKQLPASTLPPAH